MPYPCRDVLRSIVASLKGALSNSLQLSAVVNSVLGSQGQAQHPTMEVLPEGMADSQPGMFTNWDMRGYTQEESLKCMKSKTC